MAATAVLENACACTSNLAVKVPLPNTFTNWLEEMKPAGRGKMSGGSVENAVMSGNQLSMPV